MRGRRGKAAPAWAARLQALAAARPRFGYRRLHLALRQQGEAVSRKQVYRVYRELQLHLRRPAPRKKRQGWVAGVAALEAKRANQYWAMDFMQDQLSSGRRVRLFNVIDICTRECLAIEVGTRLSGHVVRIVLDEIARGRGYPEAVQCDNGPEFTGRVLRHWAQQRRVRLHYSQPGRPMQNGYIESFNGRMRDECLNQHDFLTVAEVRAITQAWRHDYNHVRPHGGLGGRTPRQAALEKPERAEPAALCAPASPLANQPQTG